MALTVVELLPAVVVAQPDHLVKVRLVEQEQEKVPVTAVVVAVDQMVARQESLRLHQTEEMAAMA